MRLDTTTRIGGCPYCGGSLTADHDCHQRREAWAQKEAKKAELAAKRFNKREREAAMVARIEALEKRVAELENAARGPLFAP